MISAIILTKNEEKNIAACIDTVAWCDEVVVIDDNSSDKTIDIAKRKGAKVFIHELNKDFAAQRNYAMSKASGDWLFFIDADERVSSPLWFEIMQQTSETSIGDMAGFYIKRQDTIWGKVLKYGETGNIKLLRLAKKNVGEWNGSVHETWKVNGPTAVLNNALDHFPHTTIEEFLKEINLYTDIRANELYDKKVKSYWWSPVVYPFAKFILNYYIRRGFLDGLPGFVLSMHMSLHSFLVRSKLWLMWNK